MIKLVYGKEGQLYFDNEREYYETLGALCNEKVFYISFEENSKTNSWSDAYRIRCKIGKDRLLEPLQRAVRDRNRINCNEYIKNLHDNHKFEYISEEKRLKGYYNEVIKTVPDKYVEAFNKGYYMYLESKDNNENKVFKKGSFYGDRVDSVESAKEEIVEYEKGVIKERILVFISHKHEDLEELKEILGFLEKNFNVKVYIDSRDPEMPDVTSGETAKRIKDRIDKCDKFILLATNKAIESKWCNWELGYGDAQKYMGQDISLFPIKGASNEGTEYKGNEYLAIYPYIMHSDGEDQYCDGSVLSEGYYVRIPNPDNTYVTISLEDWLNNSLKENLENSVINS